MKPRVKWQGPRPVNTSKSVRNVTTIVGARTQTTKTMVAQQPIVPQAKTQIYYDSVFTQSFYEEFKKENVPVGTLLSINCVCLSGPTSNDTYLIYDTQGYAGFNNSIAKDTFVVYFGEKIYKMLDKGPHHRGTELIDVSYHIVFYAGKIMIPLNMSMFSLHL